MNTQRIDELERELRFEVPEPPAGLRERLLAELPADLPAAPAADEQGGRPVHQASEELPRFMADRRPAPQSTAGAVVRPWWRRPRLLAAAAGLAVVALATGVVLRMDVAEPGAPSRSSEAPVSALSAAGERGVGGRAGIASDDQEDGSVARQELPLPAEPASAVQPGAVGSPLGANESGRPAPGRREEAEGGISAARTAKKIPLPDSGDTASELAPPARAGSGSSLRRERAATEGDLDVYHDEVVVSGEAPVLDVRSVTSSTYVADGRSVGQESPPPLPAPPPPPPPPVAALEMAPPPGASGLERQRSDVARRLREVAPAEEAKATSRDQGIAFRGGSPQPIPDPQPVEPPFVNGEGSVARPSTGGTAEPNDRPYGDMFFRPSDSNPFVDTEDDALSTFGLDVDTGSYTLARSYLDRGHLPEPDGIRVEEWVNAFGALYGDVAPLRDDFALTAEGAPSPFAGGERYRLLRFGIRARELTRAERPPVVLTFVIDVSGSMNQENRLGLVKRSLDLLLDALEEGDRVGVVVYGSQARIVLPHSGDLGRVRAAVHGLYSEGSTNAEAGLALGYDLAGAAFRERATNRVVLCSDGVANVGATGPESILERIGAEARRGIELTTIGFGMGNYNDALMERLADQGDGRYAYVDTLAEARRLFVDELSGTLHSIAADAKVQVAFDPAVVERWRLLGYENRDVADERFRDDTVDAGEIGFGHAVTALYEVKLREDAPRRGTVARLALRYRQLASGEVIEVARGLALGDLASRWERARPELRLAGAVAETAELLRRSFWAKGSTFAAVARELDRLPDRLAEDDRVRELARLVVTAERLAASAPGGDPRAAKAGSGE